MSIVNIVGLIFLTIFLYLYIRGVYYFYVFSPNYGKAQGPLDTPTGDTKLTRLGRAMLNSFASLLMTVVLVILTFFKNSKKLIMGN